MVWLIYRCLMATWKIEIHESPTMQERLSSGDPCILAHWHGDELAMLGQISRYRVATIASTSVDGDLMNKLIYFMGGVTVRGSSTRGGISALKGLLRIIRDQKRNSSFAVDGPKGPIYKVKPGVFEVSRLMNAPIFPGGVFCDRAWKFERSWNKTYLPKPFARVQFVWGEPIGPFSREIDAHDPQLAAKLEEALHCSREIAHKKNFAQ